MNWYKYWYYTIFFVYDSICKSPNLNKESAVGLFSVTVYMVIAIINSVLYSIFDCNITKGLCHIYSHLLLSLVIYCLNGFLFWSEKKAISERSIYREISKQQKKLIIHNTDNSCFCDIFLCVIQSYRIFHINILDIRVILEYIENEKKKRDDKSF